MLKVAHISRRWQVVEEISVNAGTLQLQQLVVVVVTKEAQLVFVTCTLHMVVLVWTFA